MTEAVNDEQRQHEKTAGEEEKRRADDEDERRHEAALWQRWICDGEPAAAREVAQVLGEARQRLPSRLPLRQGDVELLDFSVRDEHEIKRRNRRECREQQLHEQEPIASVQAPKCTILQPTQRIVEQPAGIELQGVATKDESRAPELCKRVTKDNPAEGKHHRDHEADENETTAHTRAPTGATPPSLSAQEESAEEPAQCKRALQHLPSDHVERTHRLWPDRIERRERREACGQSDAQAGDQREQLTASAAQPAGHVRSSGRPPLGGAAERPELWYDDTKCIEYPETARSDRTPRGETHIREGDGASR